MRYNPANCILYTKRRFIKMQPKLSGLNSKYSRLSAGNNQMRCCFFPAILLIKLWIFKLIFLQGRQ